MFSALPPPRRRLLFGLIAAVGVAVVAVAVAAVSTSGGGHAKAQAVTQAVTGPVLLIPGYGGSTTSLQTLTAQLRAAGRDATVVDLPDKGQGDLTAQAKALGTAVQAALDRTGAKSVDVVGYSAGGVVARLWLRDQGGAALTRRVVTLGSPQHGTQIADLGASLAPSQCPVACQQLTTTSGLLAKLNAGGEVPSGPTFVSIWTTHDDVVLPPDSARLTGAAINITVQSVCADDTVNHTGLPTDPLVDGVVTAYLAPGAPPQLTAADCTRLRTPA